MFSVVVISLSCLLTLNLDMFIFMFVCITLPHIAIVIMELSEIKDCIIECIELRMLKNAHDAVTIRYGATTVQAGSAMTASRSPTNVHDLAVFM